MAAGLIISLETIRNTHSAEYIQSSADCRKQMGQFCVTISWINMKNLSSSCICKKRWFSHFQMYIISVSGQEATALRELEIRDDEDHFHRPQVSSRLRRERRDNTADTNHLLPTNSLFSKVMPFFSLLLLLSSSSYLLLPSLHSPNWDYVIVTEKQWNKQTSKSTNHPEVLSQKRKRWLSRALKLSSVTEQIDLKGNSRTVFPSHVF